MTEGTNLRPPKVVFILGIMPRSGTYFLSNLLSHHPSCEKSVIPEDGFIAESHLLMKYVTRNHKIWKQNDDLPNVDIENILPESIGDGLIKFLFRATREVTGSNPDETIKYMVTKTPQVQRLHQFFRFFPHEKLLILVRDGRSLNESITRSFNHNFEQAIRDWVEAAQEIIEFQKKENKNKYLLVKYENLYLHTQEYMCKILDFLELGTEEYDFEKAMHTPVVGSSTFGRGNGKVHWDPVQKTTEFDPLSRIANWSRKQHERFNWLAEKELLYFGYEPKKYNTYIWYWKCWNYYRDIVYLFKKIGSAIIFEIKVIKNRIGRKFK